jgi:DNA/RNA endonuclease G (NUC1)
MKMRTVFALALSTLLIACSSEPQQPIATAAKSSLPSTRGEKMANISGASVATLAAATSSRVDAYAACQSAFYDEPPKVRDRVIVLLCEREGRQIFFASGYSEKDQRSIWSAYRITARMVQRIDDSPLSRDGYTFKANKQLVALGVSQPRDADYANSESFMKGKKYQRGHYAPAETMTWTEPALAASFLLTNVAPQFANMNGVLWACFEKSIREWADMWDTMFVIVGGGVPTIGKIGEAEVTVPKIFFSVIVRKDTGAALAVAIPNDGSHEYDLPRYMKSVATVERESGVIFDLPQGVKEAKPSPSEWPNTCHRQRNVRDES